MYRQAKRISTLLLLLLVHTSKFISATYCDDSNVGLLSPSIRVNYDDVLFNQWNYDKLSLVLPRVLLEDYYDVNAPEVGLTEECRREIGVYKEAIDRREKWAMKMQDASSTTASGIFHGNIIDLGNYDECVGVATEIHGRHCTYTIKPTASDSEFLPIYPLLSICLPSSCEAEDVARLFNNSINDPTIHERFNVSIGTARCSENRFQTSYTGFIIFSSIMTVYVSFLMLCSYLHLAHRHVAPEKRSETIKTLVRFSYLKNSKAIWSLRTSQDDVRILHGMRVLSTAWIVLVHECLMNLFRANANFLDLQWYFTSWLSLMPLLGMYCVDTFFSLSGFLVAYQFLRKMKRDNGVSLPRYYLHRFLRLTPPVAVSVHAGIAFMPKLASGPRWDWFFDVFVTGCCTKWWSVLTYTQNLVDKDNWCLYHLWSLAADMQFFLISPLILYPLYKRPRIGKAIIIVLLSFTMAISGAILGCKKYSAMYFSRELSIPRILGSFKDIYQMPYTRAAPWLIGLWFGYEVHERSAKKLGRTTLYFGWFLGVFSLLFCVLGTKSFTESSYRYNPTWEIIFTVLQKPAWSFAICWMIYADVFDACGWVSKVLSSRVFLPFSRMSYSIYLIHVVLPLMQVGTTRGSTYYGPFALIHSFISNLVISVVLGFAFALTFEKPALILEDMLLKDSKKKPISQNGEVQTKNVQANKGITVEK